MTVSPTYAYGELYGGGSVSTWNMTANATGGTPPYTYLWERVSGDTFYIYFPYEWNTGFWRSMVAGNIAEGVARVTVTDSAAATATISFSVEFVTYNPEPTGPGGGRFPVIEP